MSDVFLSYTLRDSTVAARLAEQLMLAGVSVFEVENFRAGDDFYETLSAAIAQARAFVLLVPESGTSEWVQKELKVALARSASDGLLVLPVLLPGREPAGDVLRFRYIEVDAEHDFKDVVDVVGSTLRSAEHALPSPAGLRLSFLSSLLDTDLTSAPHAAALVLEEISQTVGGGTEEFERQLAVLRQATEWGESYLGPSHPSVAPLRHRLADVLGKSGRHQESIELRRRSLQVSASSGERVELGLGLANQLLAAGLLDEAAQHYQQSLELASASSSDSPTAASLVGLGMVARLHGDLNRARRYLEQAVHLTTRLAEPSARTSALVGLCEVLNELGDTEGSRRYGEEALWLSRTTLAGDDALALRAAALASMEDGAR
jgi:tetratricopeptide (TPR) repeat protein